MEPIAFITVTILFILAGSSQSCKVIPNNMCAIDDQTKFCKFRDIHLNMTHLYLQPESEIPSNEVTHLDLGGVRNPNMGSKIYILTSEFCDTFVNIEEFYGAYLGLQEIQEDAFNSCKNLRILNLNVNSLRKVTSDIFTQSQNLMFLDVSDNILSEFDMNIFEVLTNLRGIDTSVNVMKVFDTKKLTIEAPMLKTLILRDNELTTIDEKEVVIKFPGLEHLYLCPNSKMTPFRTNQIVDYLEANGIETMRESCPVI